jgi:hypothetical protein
MGINDKNFEMLEGIFERYPITTVLELGAQNFYQSYKNVRYGSYASEYYKSKGVQEYQCIDLNGENNALRLDLSIPHILRKFDMVTDFGTSEHVGAFTREQEELATDKKNDTWKNSPDHLAGIQALYNCWTTKYNASRILIASANPATGHWPAHGHFYYTPEFYKVLASLTGMTPVYIGEHYAMGNYESGKEVCCVLNVRGSHWISLEEFSKAFEHIYPN